VAEENLFVTQKGSYHLLTRRAPREIPVI